MKLRNRIKQLLREQPQPPMGGQVYQNARFTIKEKCDGSSTSFGNTSVDGLTPQIGQYVQPLIHWQNPTVNYIREVYEDFKVVNGSSWPPTLTPVLPNGDPDPTPSLTVMQGCPSIATCVVNGSVSNSYNSIIYHGSLPCQAAGGPNPNQITYNCIESDKRGVEGRCKSVSGSGGQFETEDECMEACGRHVDRRKRKED